jgi:hypothetical protein
MYRLIKAKADGTVVPEGTKYKMMSVYTSCMYIRIYVRMYVCVCVCMYLCICMYVRTYICVYVFPCGQMN